MAVVAFSTFYYIPRFGHIIIILRVWLVRMDFHGLFSADLFLHNSALYGAPGYKYMISGGYWF
jgi:hypothetical protein